MGLRRNVVTRCFNYNPRGPALAVSAWSDLLQGLLSGEGHLLPESRVVTPASAVLACLQEEVLKGKFCCFSHWESVGDGNRGRGGVRLTWKCYVGLKGLSGL